MSTVFFTDQLKLVKYAFGAPKICVGPTPKKVFHIWAVTNHKSQICDCNTQTQMRCGNAPISYYSRNNFFVQTHPYFHCAKKNFGTMVHNQKTMIWGGISYVAFDIEFTSRQTVILPR